MEGEKPRLPKRPRQKEKIKNTLFVLVILAMIGGSIFFFWKAFTGGRVEEEKKVEESLPTPEPTEEETSEEAQKTEGQTYTVKEGDTLWKIASEFGVTTDDIVKANNLEDANKITVGQELTIPESTSKETTEEELP